MEVAAKNLWLHMLLNRCRDSCIRFCREADHHGLTPPLGHSSPTPSPHSQKKNFSLFAAAAAGPAACPVSPAYPKSQINPHDAQGRDWFQSLLGLSEMKDCSDFTEQIIHGNLAACEEGAR